MTFQRCRLCVIPNTRPDTAFIDGVCSACRSFEKRKSFDWEAREKDLIQILDSTPTNSSGFDCIVPSSGGKDSTWQVLKLIELGARPLVVTATTCHLTPIGRANIDNLARFATTIEVSPNKTVRAKLNRLGLEMVGDISWPEHVSIFTTPFRVACDLGIPLIFYGENPQEAYGGPQGAEVARTMTRRWVSEFGGFLGLRPADMVGIEGITALDMLDYMPPSTEEIDKLGVTAYFLGQFFEWDSTRNARVAMENGMQAALPSEANWWEWENLDCSFTWCHDHMMYRKFGYGRAASQLSVDIRAGLISREYSIGIIEEIDGILPEIYAGVPIEESLHKIGVRREKLEKIMDQFTQWNLFGRVENGRPILNEFT